MDTKDQSTVDSSVEIPEIDTLTKDYSKYLDVNALKERQCFYDGVEEMLTKLDEFGGLVDMIRSDTNLCLNEAVPRIQTKCEDMKKLFVRIDQLEAFVGVVRQNVSVTEDLVNKGEQDLGSFSVKTFFSSLLGQKKPSQTRDTRPTFQAPDIFVTEEYLTPELPVEEVPKDSSAEKQEDESVVEHSEKSQTDS